MGCGEEMGEFAVAVRITADPPGNTPKCGKTRSATFRKTGAAISPPQFPIVGSSMTTNMARRGRSTGANPTNEAITCEEE